MKRNIKVSLLVLFFLSFAGFIFANIGYAPTQTTFYFQRNGKPVEDQVKFTIKCYGKKTDEIKKLSELSKTCKDYGCSYDTTAVFSSSGNDIKYCDIEGKVNDKEFSKYKFLGDSLNKLKCHSQNYDIYDGDKYYKETSQYKKCRENVYREYYPQGDGEVKGKFICDKYKKKEDLIPTDLSTEQNGPCYRYGYTIKDNTCYKIPEEFFNCVEEEDNKLDKCNKYLKNVTDKIKKTKGGMAFDQLCELEIAIPDWSIQEEQSEVSRETSDFNIFKRTFGLIKCYFDSLFGGSRCYDL